MDPSSKYSEKMWESGKNEGEEAETTVTMNFFAEKDDFIKRWSGMVLLGPTVPAIYAALIVVIGNIILNTWQGVCNFPLDAFITGAVVLSYMFLLVFSWSIFGDEMHLHFPLSDRKIKILRPFGSLKELMVYYVILFAIVFFVMAWGTSLMPSAIFCATTAPMLYHFSSFIVVVYWLMFLGIIIFVVKTAFGDLIGHLFASMTRDRSNLEMEELIFKREWMKIDISGKYYMSPDDVPLFLTNLGIPMPPDEIQQMLKGDWEPNPDNGLIDYYKMLRWFRKFSSNADGFGEDDVVQFDEPEFEEEDNKKKKKDKKKKKKSDEDDDNNVEETSSKSKKGRNGKI